MAEFAEELSILNCISDAKALHEFQRCCGSKKFATEITKLRPFRNVDTLMTTATTTWWNLNVEDWLEAFSAHPMIGDANALKEKFSKSNWEGNEQSGTNTATDEVIAALQQCNKDYHTKNGFIFLICATGKSATEMLEALQLRLNNDRDTEIQIAAGEQDKITKLRLIKLLQSFTPQTTGGAVSKL